MEARERARDIADCLLWLDKEERLPRILSREERQGCKLINKLAKEEDVRPLIEMMEGLWASLEVEKIMGPLPTYDRECLICGKKLEPSVGTYFDDDPAEVQLVPAYPGVLFETTGNYGSTIFDSVMGNEHLHVVICDDCLKERASRVFFFKTMSRQRKMYDIQRWNPEKHYGE